MISTNPTPVFDDPILVPCCRHGLPRMLMAVVTNLSKGDCADGLQIELGWDSTQQNWIGTGSLLHRPAGSLTLKFGSPEKEKQKSGGSRFLLCAKGRDDLVGFAESEAGFVCNPLVVDFLLSLTGLEGSDPLILWVTVTE